KFPIDKQEEFPEAADFLYRTFLVEIIPEFVFSILFFPPSGWDLFSENDNTDTIMLEPLDITNEKQITESEITHKHS
ncbi:20864_t:CDS:1, partial [Gigaspora margarita]